MESLYVQCGDQTIHVVQAGPASSPCVLFLHGYPDSHRTWLPLMEQLQDAFHVVAFDLRGVCDSRPVPPAASYRIEALLPDIACVLDAVVGRGARAHLVGHDWGSTIGWSFVAHPEFGSRVLSWQSISGPHLGIWIRWMRDGLVSLRWRTLAPVLRQLVRSSYVLLLLAWPLPEIFWWLGGVGAWRIILQMAGVPRDDSMLNETRERVLSMTLRPMALYRRNVLRPPPVPDFGGIDTPTQLIVSMLDPFVLAAVFDGLGRYVTKLTVRCLPARHWAQRSHPIELAECIRDFLQSSTSR